MDMRQYRDSNNKAGKEKTQNDESDGYALEEKVEEKWMAKQAGIYPFTNGLMFPRTALGLKEKAAYTAERIKRVNGSYTKELAALTEKDAMLGFAVKPAGGEWHLGHYQAAGFEAVWKFAVSEGIVKGAGAELPPRRFGMLAGRPEACDE